MGFLKNLLGLGVAAGTAYAVVKVAKKYNEKKNANADLNGDGTVDCNDTVYGVKDAAREVYKETAAKGESPRSAGKGCCRRSCCAGKSP